MMFVPYPAYGHVRPMLPVVGEAVRRGVRVRVLVDSRYAGLVEAAGARPVVPGGWADVFVPARFGGPGTVRYLAGRVRKRVFGWATRRALWDALRDRPDLVVLDPAVEMLGAFVRGSGCRVASFATSYARRASVRHACGDDRLVLVNAIRELQPHVVGRTRLVGPSVWGDESPDDLGFRGGDRVLLVSPGTVFAWTPGYLRAVALAAADSGWQVVMATGHVDPDDLGTLPGSVVARRRVPQRALLGRCSAFMTHAGMNSSLEALAAGVPMVVRPRAGDQRVIARRLIDLGVAVRAPRRGADIAPIAERLVTDSDVWSAVGRLRDSARAQSAVADAVDHLVAEVARRA